MFADSSAAPQIELGTTIFNFVVQCVAATTKKNIFFFSSIFFFFCRGVRQTLSFATPSFGANGKSVEAKPTLTTSTRYFAEAAGATFDVTADFVNASGSVAVALPLPEGVVGGAKAQLDQASGLKSFDVAVRLGASGLTLLGKGLLAGAVGAAAPVWSATYYSRLSQTLAVGAEADSLRYVRVGALHDATPFTSVRVKLDNNSRAAIAADTVLSSALTASFGVDFDLNNRRDLKWGVSLKFA